MPRINAVLREVRRFIDTSRPSVEPDGTLLTHFAGTRDERAFAELIRRHGPMVLGVCRRVLRHTADAEDACQATFLILVRKAGDVRDPERLGPWLFGVAWRMANKLRLSRRVAVRLPEDLADSRPAHDWPVELDAAIARLPEKYRTPIVLCHVQGLSATEVAQRLRCAPATIATRLFRARAALRRRLKALGYSVPAALVAGSALQVPQALASALGETAAGRTISPTVARLADGAFRSLLMTQFRWTAAAAALCLAGVGVLGFRAGGQEPRDSLAPPPMTEAPPPRLALPNVPPVGVIDQPAAPATLTTANFRVTAPSTRIAQLIADAAERFRKESAVAWLGKELPAWPQPCPVRVLIGSVSVGATTFNFDGGTMTAEMHVEGELDRLLVDVVPHEVTHCVMADHFRGPLPRWADEGISLLSETDEEQSRHRTVAQQALRAGELVSVRAIIDAKEYPERNIATFFAQSFCMTKVLVDRKDRPTFVQFVKDGMKDGWQTASKKHYGYATLADLEADFLRKLGTSAAPEPVKAGHTSPTLAIASADADGRITVLVPAEAYQPVTSYRVRHYVEQQNGTPVTRTVQEPLTSYQLIGDTKSAHRFAKGEVKAFHPDGKAVDEKTLIEALKGSQKPVVLTTQAGGIDKTLASLLKPDTLILVIPAAKLAPAVAVPAVPAVGR